MDGAEGVRPAASGGVSRRALLAGGGAALGVFSASCAGAGGPSGSAAAPRTLPPATVEFAWYQAGKLIPELERTILGPFRKRYPSVTVNVITVESGLFPGWVNASIAAGASPDALEDAAWNARGLVAQGLVQPIDDLAKRDKLTLPAVNRQVLETKTTHEGKLWSLPYGIQGNPGMVYNRTLFQEAGIPEPPADSGQAWPFVQWLSQMQRLSKTGEDGAPQRFAVNRLGQGVFLPSLWGGQWLSDDLKTVQCDTKPVIDAYAGWYEANRTGVAPVGETAALTALFGSGNFFLTGRVASTTIGPFDVPTLAKADHVDWAFMPLPKGTTSAPEVYFAGLALMKPATKREQAWAWLTYLYGENRFATLQGRCPAAPADAATWMDALLKDRPQARPRIFVQGIERARPRDPFWDHPRANELNTEIFMPTFRRIMSGQVTAADELRRIKSPMQALVGT